MRLDPTRSSWKAVIQPNFVFALGYLPVRVADGRRAPWGGEHKPIIDQPLWDAVQAQLASGAIQRHSGSRTRQASLLTGLLFDGEGNRMTPSHAIKKGTCYRYYVSRPLITKNQTERSAGLRIPAVEIEQLVTSRVRQWLLDPGSVDQATSARFLDPSTQRRLAARAQEIEKRWPELPMARRRAVLTALIDCIDVGVGRIDIRLRSARLRALVYVAATPLPSVTDEESESCQSQYGCAAPQRHDPGGARTMITATQCRCARTLLRWSVSKLSSTASVSESAVNDFELERRQPNAITTDAIRRAFEDVGVVFLRQDDVRLRRDMPAAS